MRTSGQDTPPEPGDRGSAATPSSPSRRDGSSNLSRARATDPRSRAQEYIALFLRLALGAAFLSAVADRFGLWGPPGDPGVAWGAMGPFLAYTAELNPWAPAGLVPVLGWVATVLEVLLGVLLVLGLQTRRAAFGSGVLLFVFAMAMALAGDLKGVLDASVLTASAAALLLATHPAYRLGLDGLTARR